jgi:hypothetical protein
MIVRGPEAVDRPGRRRAVPPGDAGFGAAVCRLVPGDQGAHAHRDHRAPSWCGRRSPSRCSACHWRCRCGRRPRPGNGRAFWSAACWAAGGHFFLTRSYHVADISATQSAEVPRPDLVRRDGLAVFQRPAHLQHHPGRCDHQRGDDLGGTARIRARLNNDSKLLPSDTGNWHVFLKRWRRRTLQAPSCATCDEFGHGESFPATRRSGCSGRMCRQAAVMRGQQFHEARGHG